VNNERLSSVKKLLKCKVFLREEADDISIYIDWAANRLTVEYDELSKLRTLCEKLIEVNEFYASPTRWRSQWPNKGEHVIGDTDNISRGGKRAREIAKDET